MSSEHLDIDLLCRNRDDVINAVSLQPRFKGGDDSALLQAMIAGVSVPIDLRCIDDGYYCTSWENDMLKNRKLRNNMCYVMDDENYRYSLLYHALLQKHSIASDYRLRFKRMFPQLHNDDEYIRALEDFMSAKGYKATFPEKSYTIFRWKIISRKLVDMQWNKRLGRVYFKIKSVIRIRSRIKSAIKLVARIFNKKAAIIDA